MNNSFIPKMPNEDDNISNEQLNLSSGSDENSEDNLNFANNTNNDFNQNTINPYRDYLPENRAKREFNISPKVMKVFLTLFWLGVICVVCLIGFKYLYGVDVFEVKSRNYNLNLAETINLDNIYASDDVIWESDSDNVTIKNNVVFANKVGSAYILGRVGNQQVSDVKISVLSEDSALSLENHSVSLNVGENTTIKVNTNNDNSSKPSSDNGNLGIDNILTSADNEDDSFEDSFFTSDDDSIPDGYYEESIPEINDNVTNDEDDSQDDNEIDSSDSTNNDNINSDSTNNDKNFEYKSSDDTIAKVDDKGNVTPVSPGTVIITVKDNEGNTDHTYVTVEDDDLVFQNSSYNLNESDSLKVDYDIKGNKYKSSDIVWSSSDSDVCSVDSNGVLYGKKEGTVTITAKIGDKIQKKFNVMINKNKILPTSLSISINNLNLFIGESEKINATVLPVDTLINKVYYSSKNENIASVDDKGIVVGKGIGNTIVTASTINGIKKTVDVVVNKKNIPVSKVYFKNSNVDLEVGKSIKLDYVIEPSNATDKNVQFNYDKNMVSIDENGVLKALKSGNTTVELISSNGIKSILSVRIKSNDVSVTDIKLSVSEISLEVGKSKKIDYTVLPSNATNKEITYLSDNNIVSVDNYGVIKALKVGTSHVRFQSNNGVVAVLKVNVISSKEVIRKLLINNGDFTMNNGTSRQLDVTVEGENIQSTKVWSSSNTNVLQVDNNGRVTAKNVGESVVTLKLGEKSTSIKIKVVNSTSKVTSISVNKNSATIKMGSTEKLNASVNPSNATNKGITWKSDNTNIVQVLSDGTIKGISKGKTTVIVTSNDDKNISKKIKINVTAAADDSKLSNLENAKSYKKIKVLKSLTIKNLKEEITFKAINDFFVGQSFTATSDYYIATLINCPNRSEKGVCISDNTKVLFYNRKSKKITKVLTRNLGHTNGITNNPRTKMIYTSNPTYEFSYKDISNINKVSLKKMSWSNKAIAYDNTTNQYYLVNSKDGKNEIYVYDANFKFIKKFSMIRNTNQDCSAFKGLMLCATGVPREQRKTAKTNASVDVYRVSNNAYVGTINVNTMDFHNGRTYGIELEDVVYIGKGKFGLYFNYTGHVNKTAARIYSTSDFPIS